MSKEKNKDVNKKKDLHELHEIWSQEVVKRKEGIRASRVAAKKKQIRAEKEKKEEHTLL